jgi:DNA-binding GntR family transcriptional regulator
MVYHLGHSKVKWSQEMPQASDVVYHKLKSMIYRGALSPGARLVERTLAKELGTSRVPVREGLARLETEGLVRSVPNSATFVEDLLPRDVLEIFSMRLVLEPFATRLAASGKSVKRLAAMLGRLCEQMDAHVDDNDWHKLEEVDYQFHLLIVRSAGHRRLLRAYESSHIRIVGLSSVQARRRATRATTAAMEHVRIAKYIEKGQADLAEHAAYKHVKQAIAQIEQVYGITL